jgi:hypothetical protein
MDWAGADVSRAHDGGGVGSYTQRLARERPTRPLAEEGARKQHHDPFSLSRAPDTIRARDRNLGSVARAWNVPRRPRRRQRRRR